MNDYELEKLYNQLTENEKDLLFNGIDAEAAKILLKMFPQSGIIQSLVDVKTGLN